MKFEQASMWLLYLCNDVGPLLECRPVLIDSIMSDVVESEQEALDRKRRHIIQIGTNRREFLFRNRSEDVFQGELAGRFLDRVEQGWTYCVSLQVEVLVHSYGELPDYAAYLEFMCRDIAKGRDPSGVMPPSDWLTRQMLDRYSILGRWVTIEAPAWLPINALGEGDRRVVSAVLEIVSPSLAGQREFKARLFSRQRLDISAGDTLGRTVRWNAGGGEKRQSVMICRVI